MSATISPYPNIDKGLDVYFKEVASFARLTPKEEFETACRWKDEGDVNAAHALILANLRFVIKIANEYQHYGFRILDLIQEGNVGLMRAVHKFDPHKGFRLITYAVWWIRHQIHDFIQKSWSLVNISKSREQRCLFTKLQSFQSRLKSAPGARSRAEEDKMIADDMGIPVDKVTNFRSRVDQRDYSTDVLAIEDGTTYGEFMEYEGPNQEEALADKEIQDMRFSRVAEAIEALSERDQRIVRARLLAEDPVTLKDLGEEFGVSKERIRQLETKAKAQLRDALLDLQPSSV